MRLRFDHFDLLAPIYESVIRGEKQEEFWSLLDAHEDSIVLDTGGGTGRISQFLVGKVKQIIVSDTSTKMLRQAQTKGGLLSVCCPSEQMPFPGGLFDRVIMVDALHHVENQRKTASELWRVLKPGGHILIEEPDIHHFVVKIIALVEKLALMRSHFLTYQQIGDLFSHFGDSIEISRQNGNACILIRKKEN
jgi:ubiquinone/menaquinone biosynthesis C-methylase UbiE